MHTHAGWISTTSEAADYVRLGERKLYELVTEGAIPGSKVTGKWLFPRHELDLWVLSGLARPAGMTAADPPPIIGGSQDDLLEWTLRESGSGLASLAEGMRQDLASSASFLIRLRTAHPVLAVFAAAYFLAVLKFSSL